MNLRHAAKARDKERRNAVVPCPQPSLRGKACMLTYSCERGCIGTLRMGQLMRSFAWLRWKDGCESESDLATGVQGSLGVELLSCIERGIAFFVPP
jgi:hypothetical protein